MSNNEQSRTIAVIGGDLMAQSRIEAAATASSVDVERLSQDELGALEEAPAVDLVVLDLDTGGRALIDTWASLAGESGPRAVGYFSHVDATLGDHAQSKGVEAIPRGRFWRSLEEILAAL